MPKKECPSCAMEIEDAGDVCPVCGYEFARHGGVTKWVAILLALIFLASIIWGISVSL